MDWQLFFVLVIVGSAAAFLLRRFVRQAKGKDKAGCDKCE